MAGEDDGLRAGRLRVDLPEAEDGRAFDEDRALDDEAFLPARFAVDPDVERCGGLRRAEPPVAFELLPRPAEEVAFLRLEPLDEGRRRFCGLRRLLESAMPLSGGRRGRRARSGQVTGRVSGAFEWRCHRASMTCNTRAINAPISSRCRPATVP